MATLTGTTTRSLVDILDHAKIEQLAGKENAELGQKLKTAGKVRNLKEKNGAVVATVKDGTGGSERDCRVEFWVNDGDLDFICNCAAGAKGAFCAHCAATALLWLEARPKASRGKGKVKPRSLLDDIAAYLALEDKKAIISFLLAYAKTDADLQRALWAAAANSGLLKVDASSFRQVIEKAMRRTRYNPNETYAQYARKVQPIITSLAQLLDVGRAAEVLELADLALHEVYACYENLNGSSQETDKIADKLLELHLRAAAACRPDVTSLAAWLFQWRLTGEMGDHDLVEEYEELLGTEGMAAYRAMLEREWEKIPALTQHSYGTYDVRRQRITSMMMELADQSGELEFKVSVLRRDLSTPTTFIKIIELYDQAGEHEKALQWAKEGLQAYSYEHLIFKNFIADQHLKLGQSDQAMAIAWKTFRSGWRIEAYVRLHDLASHLGQWPEWRAKAMQALQDAIAKEDRSRPGPSPADYWRLHLREHRIRILAWDGDLEGAWNEAQAAVLSANVILELAAKLETTHPARAAALYQRTLNPTINLGNNSAYKEAVGVLSKIEALMERSGQTAEFNTLLLTLRKKHSVKFNFIEKLDKAGMVR